MKYNDKYTNTYSRTIEMNPVDVTSGTYTDYSVDHNDREPEFKVDDHLII